MKRIILKLTFCAKLLVFVEIGNGSLWCLSIEDVTGVRIKNPERFFELAGL